MLKSVHAIPVHPMSNSQGKERNRVEYAIQMLFSPAVILGTPCFKKKKKVTIPKNL